MSSTPKKKKKFQPRPWCWYCEREFDDEKILIQHQKSKHFKCSTCHKKLNTGQGMFIHMSQVHKQTINKIPNAIPGRDRGDIDVVGMEGIPLDDLIDHFKDNPAAMEQINMELAHTSSLLLPTKTPTLASFSSNQINSNQSTSAPTSIFAAPVIFPHAASLQQTLPIYPIPIVGFQQSTPLPPLPPPPPPSNQTSEGISGKISFSIGSSSSLKPYVQPKLKTPNPNSQPTNILVETGKEEGFAPSNPISSVSSTTNSLTTSSILLYPFNEESPEEKRASLGKYRHYLNHSINV